MSTGREIRLVEEDDGWWSAIDGIADVASQAPTRQKALETLDKAIAATKTAREEQTDAPGDSAKTIEHRTG